jgi:hypothetical protein
MKEIIPSVISKLTRDMHSLQGKVVSVGFDGFCDKICRPLKQINGDTEKNILFEGIEEFGNYIASKKNQSCSIELLPVEQRIGGNAPIYSNALGQLGHQVNVIASLGNPKIQSVFRGISKNCKLYSFADPGEALALEFNDGKVIIYTSYDMPGDPWKKIKENMGAKSFIKIFGESDLFAVVNWSEVGFTQMILQEMIDNVLPHAARDHKKYFLMDLADCSRRNDSDIIHVISDLEKFNACRTTILGLNENEASKVYRVMHGDAGDKTIETVCERIFERLGIHILVVHTNQKSVACSGEGMISAETYYCERPVISTGAGDNFNAGLTTGLMLGLCLKESIAIANAVSSFYVCFGHSPHQEELICYLQEWHRAIINNQKIRTYS